MGIVRALPRLVDGRAILLLRNDHGETVTIKNILKGPVTAGAARPLIREPITLNPGEERGLDVTEAVAESFDKGRPGRGERVFQISLHLDPEPPDQPAPALYRAVFVGTVLEGFYSASSQTANESDDEIGILLQGVEVWNKWRKGKGFTFVALAGADLSNMDLRNANLSEAILSNVDLTGADLSGTDLTHASIDGALVSADALADARLYETFLGAADHPGASVLAELLSEKGFEIEEWEGGFRATSPDTQPSFEIRFSPDLSPEDIEFAYAALADYYRACGGVGFQAEFELEEVEVPVCV